MEQILERVLELKSCSDHEPCILKPQFTKILKELQSCDNILTDHRTFQIINALAIEHKFIIQSDLSLLKTIIFIVSTFIKPESNIPETGKEWAFRVLRWLLVIDPDSSDIPELKKCFLMAVPTKKLYLTHLEIGLEQLVEKILFYISVMDERLLIISLDCLSEYFKIDPILMESKILTATNVVLDQLIQTNSLNILPDNFISDFLLESSSHYYNSVDSRLKTELCRVFIDVFEFQILNSNSDWFVLWLAKDLNQFKRFCQFSKDKPGLSIFLDQLMDEIVTMGRLKGFHSKLSYDNCKTD